MPLISRRDYETMIKNIAEETGSPEEEIRKDAEAVARINGLQIEEPDTMSLVEHFLKAVMT